jgi:hypothetical protein
VRRSNVFRPRDKELVVGVVCHKPSISDGLNGHRSLSLGVESKGAAHLFTTTHDARPSAARAFAISKAIVDESSARAAVTEVTTE